MSLLRFNEKFRGTPSRLISSLLNKFPGQSYIIQGDSIDDIREFTDEWVKVLVCLAPDEQGACNKCRHCLLKDHGNYPEIYELAPASKSRSILVDALREFQNKFYLKSAVGVKKIGLIYEADRMQIPAQNAFLKTLEEPPPDTYLILLTSRIDNLLNTIKSRCRIVSLNLNKTKYDEQLKAELTPILSKISGKEGAVIALEAFEQVNALFLKLRQKAELEIAEEFNELSSENDDPYFKKELKERQVVMTESKYKFYREQVVSMIEVWVAQNYLMTNGTSLIELSHQDLISHNWKYTQSDCITPLFLIEQFTQDLEGNVNESLAIQNFFLQICQAK